MVWQAACDGRAEGKSLGGSKNDYEEAHNPASNTGDCVHPIRSSVCEKASPQEERAQEGPRASRQEKGCYEGQEEGSVVSNPQTFTRSGAVERLGLDIGCSQPWARADVP